ncbi:MAG: HAMP domain-containing protein [Candidatus Taylorbacteria bacterium]|nr:HAMP domain-containing protein [Candidatus Taylorbacteria bacterium]
MSIEQKHVSIRTKVGIIVIVALAVLFFAVYAISSGMLGESFRAIEREETQRNLERANDAVQSVIRQIDAILTDWASWDDTYEFAEDRSESFIKSNLNISTIANLNLNIIAFVDPDREVIFKRAIDIAAEKEISSESIASHIRTHRTLVDHVGMGGTSVTGLISLPEGIAFVASQPILTSEREGPSRGAIVFARFLDDEASLEIGELTHLSVSLYPYASKDLPKDVLDARGRLSAGDSLIVPLSEDRIAAYKIIEDLYGEPIVILRVDTPRQVYNQGKATSSLFIASASASILATALIIVLLLNRFVVRRLAFLNSEVERIGKEHDLSQRVREGAPDEIGLLERAMNRMFSELAEAQKNEKEASAKARIADDELQKRLDEVEKLNKLMVNRELKMMELKKEMAELKSRSGEKAS